MNRDRIKIPSQITFTNDHENKQRNKHLTYGKLKILHTGTTEDGRRFSFDSLDELIKNLPHTPVTGNYISDEKDFGGHDSIKQVYGFIPEVGDYGLEEIDGEEWLVAEVGLFTSVRGGVGDIAAEIIGKSHSMELDPEGTEFTITKVDGKTLMTITKSTIVELCVLGDTKQPAFAGSGFFTEMSEEEQLNQLIAQYASLSVETVDAQINFADNSELNGGVKMDRFLDFMRETYGERIEKVAEALANIRGDDFYIRQMGDDSVVIMDFDTWKPVRISYSINDEGLVVFGEEQEVQERYLTDEEIDMLFESHEEEETIPNEDENFEDAAENDEEEVLEEEVEEEEIIEVQPEVIQPTADEIIQEEFGMDAAAIKEILAAREIDQAEFTRLQNLERETVLQTFADILDETELDSIRIRFSELSLEDIEKEASFIGFNKIKNKKDLNGLRFSGAAEPRQVITDSTQDLINKYK